MTRHHLLALTLTTLAVLTVSAWSSEVAAQQRNSEGLLKKGSVGGRLGIGLGSRTTTTVTEVNGMAKSDEETDVLLGISPGVSYAVHERVALDLGTAFWIVVPDFGLDQVSITPGTRLFAHPQFYGRLAVQNDFKAPSNTLFLTGLGYYSSLGSPAFFLEVNYIAWSRKDVEGLPIVLNAGLTF